MNCPVCYVELRETKHGLFTGTIVHRCPEEHVYIKYQHDKIVYYCLKFVRNDIDHRAYYDTTFGAGCFEVWCPSTNLNGFFDPIFSMPYEPSEEVLLNLDEIQKLTDRFMKLRAFL